MGIGNVMKAQAIKQIVKMLPYVSDENLVRLTHLAEKLTTTEKHGVRGLRRLFEQKHPAVDLAKSLVKDLSPKCRDKLVTNLMLNAMLFSNEKRKKFYEENGFMPPWLLVISPSMRCNLRCVGCYAGEYTQKDDLPIEVMDRILNEAKELGIHFIVVSGGEPFIRQDVFDLMGKHDDMYFQVYTNGTMITKDVAKKLAELGNVAPAISVEGFKEETDKRRGPGVYEKVLEAMDNLKEAGVMFGFSATPMKHNSELFMTEKFIDFYIEKGCKFGWFFQYIPIGLKPDVSLMSTPEQRTKLRHFVHQTVREKKKIFIGDFWNDGPYVCGCMAGARKYLHITCKGDVEPCVFTHFSVDNIKEKSLKEVLNSKFFKDLRANHPNVKNLLMPCMIIDNPECLKDAVEKNNAKPTHTGAETIIKDPKIRQHLEQYSKRLHELSDNDWDDPNGHYKKWKEAWDRKRKNEYW